jgi:hypothetical protein
MNYVPAREMTQECVCTSDWSVVFHCYFKNLQVAESRVFETSVYNRRLPCIFVILEYTL